jgi:hypothetical protein
MWSWPALGRSATGKKKCSVLAPERRRRTQSIEEKVKAKDRKNVRGYWRKLLIEGLERFCPQ